MIKRVFPALLSLLLCLGWAAAANDISASGTVGGTSINIAMREVKPGYYFCSIWDGDELLTLFDTVVGQDGILNETVDIGREIRTDSSLRVGVSGANTGAPDAVYPVKTENTGGSSGSGSSGSGSSGNGPSGNSSSSGSSNRRETGSSTNTPLFQPPPTETPQTSGFTDVAAGAYYYEAVQWAVRAGITAGTSADRFRPDMPCTRAQLVSFLWRAAGSPAVNGELHFADVSPNDYCYNAVLWATSGGITAGTGGNRFSPDATVTRAQTAAMLYRAAGSPVASGVNAFRDVAPTAYYAGAVQWAAGTGITAGTGAGVFSPDAPCTRAQIVTFLYRDRVK